MSLLYITPTFGQFCLLTLFHVNIFRIGTVVKSETNLWKWSINEIVHMLSGHFWFAKRFVLISSHSWGCLSRIITIASKDKISTGASGQLCRSLEQWRDYKRQWCSSKESLSIGTQPGKTKISMGTVVDIIWEGFVTVELLFYGTWSQLGHSVSYMTILFSPNKNMENKTDQSHDYLLTNIMKSPLIRIMHNNRPNCTCLPQIIHHQSTMPY